MQDPYALNEKTELKNNNYHYLITLFFQTCMTFFLPTRKKILKNASVFFSLHTVKINGI